MDTIGDDLLLLAINPDTGRVRGLYLVKYGLMGSELIRLVASGLVTITDGRLALTEASAKPTGDLELDAALASIADAKKPPKPKGWVARPRRPIIIEYLNRLSNAGRIQAEGGGSGSRSKWSVTDTDGLAAAKARLDAIAAGTGLVDLEQAAYGGLAHAVQLDRLYYRGWDNRAVRKRMKQVAQGKWTAPPADASGQPAHDAISAVTQAAIAAAIDAAVEAAASAAAAASTG